MITLGILEDDLLLTATFRAGFVRAKGFDLLFCFSELEALQHAVRTRAVAEPSIFLLEVNGGSIQQRIRRVKGLFPRSRILVIAGDPSDQVIKEALTHGEADGFVTRDLSFEELAFQLKRFHEGHPVFSQPVLKRILELFKQQPKAGELLPDPELTRRENDIARGILRGLTYKQIGEELNLSVFTVNQHVKKVYLKKGVNSRHELVSKMRS